MCYAAWPLLWYSPHSYILASHASSDFVRHSRTSSQGSLRLSFNWVSLSLLFYSLLGTLPPFYLQLSLKWLSQDRNFLRSPGQCLMILESPFMFTTWSLTTIGTKKFAREWIKSRNRITICATSINLTAARYMNHSPTIHSIMRVATWWCNFPLPSAPKVWYTRLLYTTYSAWSYWKMAIA